MLMVLIFNIVVHCFIFGSMKIWPHEILFVSFVSSNEVTTRRIFSRNRAAGWLMSGLA